MLLAFYSKHFIFTELPNDYVLTFGDSDAFSTSEYVILENKNFTALSEVIIIVFVLNVGDFGAQLGSHFFEWGFFQKAENP